ncbi:hypothetical protein HK097_007205 [Rhizophlyctis rosea]|uniref:endo-1,4-beta-xylanase n=1 Tax=Rhizophlyctis rosea TaxID=64517 RepID=A0AAD5X8Q8_9FUNG|nr:hypothetical protein HK097_007205 [Rhizophlyctis rosea]
MRNSDRILEFAQDAGAAFRGHTLSWRDSDSSPWTNNLDAAALQDTLVNHIKAIVGHYKGKVYA